MVSLCTIRADNAALLSSQSLVAVFVGGTSGLGEYAIRSLVLTHSQATSSTSTQPLPSLRIYIIGRNASSAEKIITECKTIAPGKEVELLFVKAADLSLLQDVEKVCKEVMRLEAEKEARGGGKARVDWLCMSQSNSVQSFNGEKRTKEGLDTQFSLHYYSRALFSRLLLPLLLCSTLPTGAHLTSIYAAGFEATLFSDDLSLRQPTHYTFSNVRSHVNYMTTLFFETLMQNYPGRLVATHVFPGLVITPAYYLDGYPWWFRALRAVLQAPTRWWLSLSEKEAGDRMCWTLCGRGLVNSRVNDGGDGEGEALMGTDGVRGGGAFALGEKGEVCETRGKYVDIRKGDLGEKVWEHTNRAFDVIRKGGVFEE
ncbi:hypothetical protein VTL71DRAFT_9613 [Oculimacula yallundae]|uniref:Uncharacterized protein n=1 Tax=Oculimacula yallundae TaxID=86028 RepID=A0ABR4BU74_9HELO